MTEKPSKCLMVLTFIFAWLPAFVFAVSCGAMLIGTFPSFVDYLLSARYKELFQLVTFIFIMTFGLLGFLGLSAVTFDMKLRPLIRILFLIFGIVSAFVFTVFMCLEHFEVLLSKGNRVYAVMIFSFLTLPVLFGFVHIVFNYRVIKLSAEVKGDP